MVTNYYNASNNFSAPIRKEPKPFTPEHPIEPLMEEREILHAEHADEETSPVCYDDHPSSFHKSHALFETNSDTLVLLALLWLLLTSKSDDRLLEIALIYLLLT